MSYTRILKKLHKQCLDYLAWDSSLTDEILEQSKGCCIEISKNANEYIPKLRKKYTLEFIATVVRSNNTETHRISFAVICAKKFPSICNRFCFFCDKSSLTANNY